MEKSLPASAGDKRDVSLIPGLGGSPGEGYGNPLQYSCLENFMDRGAGKATVYGIAKNWTQLYNQHFRTHIPVKQSGFRLPFIVIICFCSVMDSSEV